MTEKPQNSTLGWSLITLAAICFGFFTIVGAVYGIPFWAWVVGAVLSSPIWGGLGLWGMALITRKEPATKA